MLRAMVFIDFENFDISKYKYYKQLALNAMYPKYPTENNPLRVISPKIDFIKLAHNLVYMLPQKHALMKTFLFIPKPDEFLMQDARRANEYNWMQCMKNNDYLTIVEGKHIARPVEGYTHQTMAIDNRTSYYIVEKGTDVNLTAQLLTKCYMNAYDTAIVVSGDTDYITVMDVICAAGKNIAVAGIKNQNLTPFQSHTDTQIYLDDMFFQRCLRKN